MVVWQWIACLRPRFSLRTSLVVFAVVAAFFAWRDRPRQIAAEFKSSFANARGVEDGLQLCGLHGIAADRWTVRDVRVGEFRRAPGITGWLLNQRVASLAIHVHDRHVGYGSTHGQILASAGGVEARLDGNWQSELPPLLQWFLE
jgi:hypothetical protein